MLQHGFGGLADRQAGPVERFVRAFAFAPASAFGYAFVVDMADVAVKHFRQLLQRDIVLDFVGIAF